MTTWEQCVREVTLSADPEVVGELSGGWSGLSTVLGYLNDALVGQPFVGPVADESKRPRGGICGMLASWSGSGGDAYRDHIVKLGNEVRELGERATQVSQALNRISHDISAVVKNIPIPVLDDAGWDEWSLPNDTNLDSVDDGADAKGFLRLLRQDYNKDPSSYADGAFRDKADDLEATLKLDGSNDGSSRGGFVDTDSFLDDWYRDNTNAATKAAAPLPKAVNDERPKLVVPPPTGYSDDERKEDPNGHDPSGSKYPGGGGVPSGGGMPGSALPSMGGASFGGGAGAATPPSFGTDYTGSSPSDEDYGSQLAGAGDGGWYRGAVGGPAGLGGLGPGSSGGFGSGGLGSATGFGGAGVAGAAGGLPGLVGGGGNRPPLTSAAAAARGAAGNAGGQGARGMGMMGGGLGAHGGGAHQGEDHKSWLTEDDDPWGTDSAAAPGILR